MTDPTPLPIEVPQNEAPQDEAPRDDDTHHNGETWHPSLGGLAGLMKQEAANRLEREVAYHLELTATLHTGSNYHDGMVCNSCGLGDTSWPCLDWRSAYEVGVIWLMERAGLGAVREVS